MGEDESSMTGADGAWGILTASGGGTLESDLLLSTFAKDELKTMSEEELKEFDRVRDLL